MAQINKKTATNTGIVFLDEHEQELDCSELQELNLDSIDMHDELNAEADEVLFGSARPMTTKVDADIDDDSNMMSDFLQGEKTFLREVLNHPMLSAAEEVQLFREYAMEAAASGHTSDACIALRNHIAMHNIKMISKVVNRYRNKGMSHGSLINAGFIGLCHAITKYDVSLGYRLSTYAFFWIDQVVSRALAGETAMIAVPAEIVRKTNNLYRDESIATQNLLGFEYANWDVIHASNDAIAHMFETQPKYKNLEARAEIIGIREKHAELKAIAEGFTKQLRELTVRAPTAESFYDFDGVLPNSDAQDGATLGDTLSESDIHLDVDDDSHVYRSAYQSQRERMLAKCLAQLPERQRFIIQSHHGLLGQEQLTFAEIAKLIGMSPESVRQFEIKAMKELEQLLKQELA